jgi:hypothetical protein
MLCVMSKGSLYIELYYQGKSQSSLARPTLPKPDDFAR